MRLGIFYKNFAAWKGVSHIGLGVAALANTEYLRHHGIDALVFPVRHNIDIVKAILDYQTETGHRLTHAVISAPWISCRDMAEIVKHFPMTQFVVVSHSNVGFLQADPQGVHLLRDYIELSRKYDNLSVGGNSFRFVKWLTEAYGDNAVLLPNMYTIPVEIKKMGHHPCLIKIGSFGAIRPLKNQLTAAAAAIVIANKSVTPVEFHLSAGREEGGGNVVLNAIRQMTQDVPGFTLVLDGWTGWIEFKRLVSDMDLLIHPSYTESFNIVSADGISQGVPVVGSDAIDWLPESWKADSDDALKIADVGLRLLSEGAGLGLKFLREHNERSLKYWKKFLES